MILEVQDMHSKHEFSLAAYKRLLETLKGRFSVYPCSQLQLAHDVENLNVAIWRHDIDFCPFKAAQIARLENQLNIEATYFIQISSAYYSVFDLGVVDALQSILNDGHEVGLHYDPTAYPKGRELSGLQLEKQLLECLLGTTVKVFSLHNPTTYSRDQFEEMHLFEMLNASAPPHYHNFSYCSDSNGVWRFRSMREMIEDRLTRKLYGLTHPLWWLGVGTPREKVEALLRSRAQKQMRDYDELLALHNRPNY